MTLGSLFDGSGCAPLAASLCGITPVWSSEIEPFPARVTRARFPRMKNYGDIRAMNGAEVEPVDVICGGSPCQDLSVAGKQKGLFKGERSHLFFEMVRIIREMREATDCEYPKYVIWENVFGAFESNGGEDFRSVLQAFSEIADPDVFIPRCETRGNTGRLTWTEAGEVEGDGFSLAWRTVDAKYWGVPQRRKRIYLVLSFRGISDGTDLYQHTRRDTVRRAREILFERKGGAGRSSTRRKAGDEPSRPSARSADGGCGILGGAENDVYVLQGNGIDRADGAGCNGRGFRKDECYTLNTVDRPAVVYAADMRNYRLDARESGTIQAKDGGGYSLNYINPVIYDARGNGDGQTSATITGDHDAKISDYTNLCVFERRAYADFRDSETGSTLTAHNATEFSDLCLFSQIYERGYTESENAGTPTADESGGYRDDVSRKERKHVLRRLTPLECCRLQGFPDWWTDGVKGTDAEKFKMWGNGMTLPNVLFIMRGIAEWNFYE